MLRMFVLALSVLMLTNAASADPTLTGKAAFGDWSSDHPGVRRHIAPTDLPPPSEVVNGGTPTIVAMPDGVKPIVPPGFTIDLFADKMVGPRTLRIAPNGDVFVAESGGGSVTVLRAADGAVTPSERETFISGLRNPYGIAFYPPGPNPAWVYIAETNRIIRIPYKNGDLKATGAPEVALGGIPTTGHTTRDILFSPDGKLMYLTVGSASNAGEGMAVKTPEEIAAIEARLGVGTAWDKEQGRASVFTFDPSGRGGKIFAGGIRNCSGIALQPATGALWCATNERDGIGDDLPPDYVSRIKQGAFYGWPWYYIGDNEDPRHVGERPDLKGKITVPDVLLQPHSAPLAIAFYDGSSFPEEYRGDAFVTMHGSWNRDKRTGYKVVRILMKDGAPTGDYEDFMTGFVLSDDEVDGRPVGVAVAHDGALLVSEDGNNTIWRVTPAK